MRIPLAFLLLSSAALAGCPGDASNHAPVAVDDQATTAEDTAITVDVLANDTDADGDELAIVRAVADGHEIALVDGEVVLTPAPDFHGAITVEVEVDDGEATATSAAAITVTPVNDVPTASGATLVTGRNAALAIELAGADVDGDELTFELVDEPAHGTVAGTPPALTYTPAFDYVGEDTLRFVVLDGATASAPGTIAITVQPGTAPVAEPIAATTAEDTATTLTLAAADADGDALTFVVTTPPEHGSLAGTAPSLTYTPDPDFHGADSFAYTANDGLLTSASAEVTITVTPVNDAPLAVATVATTAEDAALPVALTGNDADGDALTFAVATGPAHGSVVVTGSTALYSPAPDHAGGDTFTFTVSDGAATSAPATVSLVITPVADAPVALAQTASGTEDQPLAIALGATDADGDALSFTIVTAPEHGTLTGTGPDVVYTPDANYHGADTLSFVAGDGGLTSAPATVAISLASVNDPPTVPGGVIAVVEDQPTTFTLPASDADGDGLTYYTTDPARGTMPDGVGPTRTYTPDPDTHGDDSFVYQVYDGHVTVSGTVTLAVASVNDAPVARDDVAIAAPGAAVTIGAVDNDEDVEGDPLTITVASAAEHGDVQIAGGDLVYTPDPGFTGSDAFTYTIDDGAGGTATATVRVGTGEFPAGVPIAWIAFLHEWSAVTAGVQEDLSADGRFLAFASHDQLIPEDTNGTADVYVLDRLDGGLERVSVSSAGVPASGGSYSPSISADGRYVAFYSSASNLTPGDVNTVVDVFVHDRDTGTTVCASVTPAGVPGSHASVGPQLSADGTAVAFWTYSFDLVDGDTNGEADVFVRDLVAGTTTRVSVTSAGTEGDARSLHAALSADGRLVAFSSHASNLVPGDSNGSADIFLHDRVTGHTERVSVRSTGEQAGGDSISPMISDDGRFIAFLSYSLGMAPGATHSGTKAFVRDRQESTTTWAFSMSSETAEVRHVDLSGDGRYLTGHLENGAAFIRDRFSGDLHAISTHDGANVYFPVFSPNGRYVALMSTAALAPLPPDTNGTQAYVLPNPL